MQKMQKRNKLIYTAAISVLIILIDQITKLAISKNMEIDDAFGFIPHIISIHYVRNEGAAFGMLSNHRWIFMTFSVAALIVMFYILKKTHVRSYLFYTSMSFIIGGGIGNMIDRTIYGSVIDFFDLEFMQFAVFNVADAFLTVGVILMAVYLLFFEKKDKKAETAAKETQDAENKSDAEPAEEQQQAKEPQNKTGDSDET